MLVFFILVAILIYGSASYYVGLRLWQAFSVLWADRSMYYWVAYSVVAATPFMARARSMRIPIRFGEKLVRFGDYWLATSYYLWLFWVGVDIIRIIARFFTVSLPLSQTSVGIALLSLVALLLVYGTDNALSTRIKSFDIHIDKTCADRELLRAVLVSDVHLGVTVNRRRLERMVNAINKLNPDIVFLAGDIIDGDVQPFVRQNMAEVLRSLNASLDLYVVMGNHEYLGGQGEMAAEQLLLPLA